MRGGEIFFRFLANKSLYLNNGARYGFLLWPRLLLITNRKSFNGSGLSLNSMTLNDLERQNKGFYGFFGDFRLRDTFQEEIAPKPTEIDMDKLRMKFLVLNADFNDLSVDFFRFKETCA